MAAPEALPMWHLLAYIEQQAYQNWRRRKRPTVDAETAYANDLSRVEWFIDRSPGGNALVTVSFYGKRPAWHDVQTFSLQRAGKGMYTVVPVG